MKLTPMKTYKDGMNMRSQNRVGCLHHEVMMTEEEEENIACSLQNMIVITQNLLCRPTFP
jgi:hypothetical protein